MTSRYKRILLAGAAVGFAGGLLLACGEETEVASPPAVEVTAPAVEAVPITVEAAPAPVIGEPATVQLEEPTPTTITVDDPVTTSTTPATAGGTTTSTTTTVTTVPGATTTTTVPEPTTTTTTVAPTTTTTVPPTTTTTLPPGPPAKPSNLGVFLPGWDTVWPANSGWCQTYVGLPQGEPGAFWSAVSHRVSQCNGNPMMVYVNGHTDDYSGTIEATLDGTNDAAWEYVISQIPSNVVFAPIAEANGNWVSYNGTVEQVRQVYAKLSAMDNGRHQMCGSFTIMPGSQTYMNAVAPYVDFACPSHYTWSAASATTLGNQAKAHAANAGLPLIWAQGGLNSGTEAQKTAWAIEAANAVAPAPFIYFNSGVWAIDGNSGGWPW